MKHPVYLCLLGYILSCSCIIQIPASCLHPDVPENGNYSPKRRRFEPGDDIIYSCKKGFALWGKERRTCTLDEVWSDRSPFCDPASQLENPSVEDEKISLPLIAAAIDGHTNTCFEWPNPKGKHMYVHLTEKVIVRTVEIYLKEDSTAFQVLTGLNNNMTFCASHIATFRTDKWIVIKCRNNVVASTIKILATKDNTLTVCEIGVYGKTEYGCEHSPNMKIYNGHFQVSRSKADLICDEGFRNKNNSRLVCDGKNNWVARRLKCDEVLCDAIVSKKQPGLEWTILDVTNKLSIGTRSRMKCSTGYRKTEGSDVVYCQKNGTWTKANAMCIEESDSKQKKQRIVLGVISLVVVLIIIGLLGTIIYFIRKQKNKEVVVVFQPQSDESVISGSEREYAQPLYDSLKGRAPEPPSTPRPFAKLSTMSKRGDSPLIKTQSNSNLADGNFDAMNSSTVYGS